jgi:hypothetical protein
VFIFFIYTYLLFSFFSSLFSLFSSQTSGTGIKHSEFNGSKTEPQRYLQIWIDPRSKGLAPRYGSSGDHSPNRHNTMYVSVCCYTFVHCCIRIFILHPVLHFGTFYM